MYLIIGDFELPGFLVNQFYNDMNSMIRENIGSLFRPFYQADITTV